MSSNDSISPADLSPIAACLIIAARRGRALRLQREAQQRQTDESTRRDDEPQRDEATKTLNQDHHKGSPNGQSDRIEAR